jgi:hypothetical protein
MKQCWAIVEFLFSSQLGSHNENQLASLHEKTKVKMVSSSHKMKVDHENWCFFFKLKN